MRGVVTSSLGALACVIGLQLPASGASSGAHPLDKATFSALGVDGLLAQLVMEGAQFANPGASASLVEDGVGGLVFYGQPGANAAPSITAGIAGLKADALIPPIISTDEEGGNVQRLAGVIGALPTPRDMAAEWTPAQTQQELQAHARLMRQLGLTMDLGPVLDTAPISDTIGDENDRSFSENPVIASLYGVAFSKGLEGGGIVPVVKHFPGLGHANGNTDTGPATDPPLAQLEGADMIPFEKAIAAGAPVVMMSNVIVPGLTNGAPATLSAPAYSLLRNQLGFKGMVITDSLDAGAISGAGDSGPVAAAKAIEAGADMVLVENPAEFPAVIAQLQDALDSGALPLSRVLSALLHVLVAKGYSLVAGLSPTLASVLLSSMGCRADAPGCHRTLLASSVRR